MVIAVTRLPALLVYARVHFLDQLRSAGTVDDLGTSLRFTKSPVSKAKLAMPRAILTNAAAQAYYNLDNRMADVLSISAIKPLPDTQ